MKSKRAAFVVILLLFIAFVAWRIFHVPYRPEVLLQAVPGSAAFVSEHDDLAARWPELTSNPLIKTLALSFGVDPEEYESFRNDKVVAWIMKRFAGKRTVIAFLPSLGSDGQPAWMLASWGGLQARMLKWGVYSGALGDFEKQTFHGGRRGWVMRDLGESMSGQFISLAVADGAVLAMLSTHPQAVTVPLERIERDSRIMPELAYALTERRVGTRDRGWIAPDAPGGAGWNYDIALDRDGLTEATFSGGPDLIPHIGRQNAQEQLDELIGVLKDSPSALWVGPFEMLASVLPSERPGGGIRHVAEQFLPHLSGGTDSFVSLSTLDYSGRILGLKVSTLMIGLRLKNRQAYNEIVKEFLDTINAEYETTLIQREVPTQGLRMHTIESVRRGPLSKLAQAERPAYTMVGDWLFVASNRKALEKVRRKTPNRAGPWRHELQLEEPTDMAAWTNLETAGDALSKILAVYDLASLFMGSRDESDPIRQNLGALHQWIDTLEPTSRLCAWGSSTAEASSARIRIGVPPDATDG